MDNLELIRTSLENWYNGKIPHMDKVSVAINYNDLQNLSFKSYHRISIDISLIGIRNNLSYTRSIYSVTENYNKNELSEQEAKDQLTKKALTDLFHYMYQNTF